MNEQDFKNLEKRLTDLENSRGSLNFPLDVSTISAIEKSPFSVLHALVLKAGFDIYTSARDITIDPPKEGETWIEDISSVQSLCFLRTISNVATKVCMPASASPYGRYFPTLTNVANLDSSQAYDCIYARIGNVVTVSGKLDIDPTTAATTVQLGISLPITSNIGATEDVGGVAFASGIASQGAAIRGDATNNRAELIYKATDVTNQPMYFTFQYRII